MKFNRQRVLSEVKALLYKMKELEQYLEGEDSEDRDAPPPSNEYKKVNLKGEYNFKNITQMLTDGFNEDELRNFVRYDPTFRKLVPKLPKSQGQDVVIGIIIDFAENYLLIETLLGWAKSKNPGRYALYTYTY